MTAELPLRKIWAAIMVSFGLCNARETHLQLMGTSNAVAVVNLPRQALHHLVH